MNYRIITVLLLFLAIPAIADNRSDRQSVSSEIAAIKIDSKINPQLEEKSNKIAECIMLLQPKHTPFVAKYIATEIVKNANQKNLDPDLVAAIIWVESEYVPFAKSSAGAIGLMQVRYSAWKTEPALLDNGVDKLTKLFHIDSNIACGTDILKSYYEESGKNIATTLFRYWTGDPKLSKKPWEVEYINKILYYYYKIREHQLDGAPIEAEGPVAVAPHVPSPTPPASKK